MAKRKKRRNPATFTYGKPKSPRKVSSSAMEDGPSILAHLQLPEPPRTPQREDRSISPAAGEDQRRASSYPNPNRDPVRPQPPPPSSPAAATTGTPSPPSQSRKTYADALTGQGSANQNPIDDFSRRFYLYLKRFGVKQEATACHDDKQPIITLNETGSSDLKIVQSHLEEYDAELALAIFSSQDRFEEWFYATVSWYLTKEKIVKNAVAVAGMDAVFYKITPSRNTLEDFVKEQGPLISTKSIFCGNFKLCVASDIGMRLVHGFLVYILKIHKQGRTWNGEFSTSDMVVVGNCLTCMITRNSRPGKSHCRATDLHTISKIFEPMFTSNEGMALYFDVLAKDLCSASNGEVEKEWYREYLRSHPAVKSSFGRFNLKCGLDRANQTIKSKGNLMPAVLLEGSDWTPIIPLEITEDTPCTDLSLYDVYWFNSDPTKNIQPFASTNGGLLRYIRNYLQHDHDLINVQSHTELEQFVAKTFPLALPYILRGLLSDPKMNELFKGHWKIFQDSRVGNDDNTEGEGGIGIRISFSEDGSGVGQV